MARQIVLLRAINVGGRTKLPMADLRRCLEAIGCADVRTVLQSGNAIVDIAGHGGAALERRIEAALVEQCGLESAVMVRSADEWATLIAGNPFGEAARDDPSHLVAMVAKSEPSVDAIERLRAAVTKTRGREAVEAEGGQVYLNYPDGIGRSKVTGTLIERALGTSVTGRNWNTVLKLAAMVG